MDLIAQVFQTVENFQHLVVATALLVNVKAKDKEASVTSKRLTHPKNWS
jgi:hypothetical protein